MRPGRFEFMFMNNPGRRIIPDGITEPARVFLTGTGISHYHPPAGIKYQRAAVIPIRKNALLFRHVLQHVVPADPPL